MGFQEAFKTGIENALSRESAISYLHTLVCEMSDAAKPIGFDVSWVPGSSSIRLELGDETRELCSVELDHKGWPIRLETSYADYACRDEAALRYSLLEIASSGSTGRIIRAANSKPSR
jgi:hypothetical protein